MQPLLDKQKKAWDLRKKGLSLNDISNLLDISKSSASLWLKKCKLSKKALTTIRKRREERVRESRKSKRDKFREYLALEAKSFLELTNITKNHLALFCALLYRCEGNKGPKEGIKFTNSDPEMVKCFINLLKCYLEIDNRKLRACIHLHEYHTPKKQILFWSEVTGIPVNQFTKPYIKPHTGKRKKENYPGCICINYHDTLLAKRLNILGEEILRKYGGIS
ncbi:MAG: hypothetical protein Q7R99_01675 [bacterium]|nr:hypothetical protein [bacterium]